MEKTSKTMRCINKYFERKQELVNAIVKNSPNCVTPESLKMFMFNIFKNINVIPVTIGKFGSCNYRIPAIMFYINDMKFFMRLDYDKDRSYDEYGWLEIYSNYRYSNDSRIHTINNYSWHGYALNTVLCGPLFGLSSVSDYISHYNSTVCRLLVAMEDAVESTFPKESQ